MSATAVSEREFQKAVCDALSLFGWRWTHFRPAMSRKGWRTAFSGSPGFPDIVAVRDERVVWIELKSVAGRLNEEQAHRLAALGAAGQDVHVSRPSDWDAIAETLR